MIYWFTFAISSGLLYIAHTRKRKVEKDAMIVIGLLVLLLLAALRADTVGRDVGTYLKPLFNTALGAGSFRTFLATCKTMSSLRDVETGFLLVSYFTVRIFHSINVLFFVIECLIIIPNYIAICKFSKLIQNSALINSKKVLAINNEGTLKGNIGIKYSIPMAMVSFCGVFYCFYLSGMRQGVACAFVTLAIIDWICKEKKQAIIFIVIAFFMHHSGIFGVALILLYILGSEKHSRTKNILMGAGIVFALFYNRIFPIVMSILQRVGLLNSKYFGWQSNAYYSLDNTSGINLATLLCMIYALGISYLIFRKYKGPVTTFLFVCSFFAICLTPFIARYATFGRVHIYFQQLTIFIFPLLSSGLYKIKRNQRKRLANVINIVFIVAYWVVTQVITNSTDTLPYMFFWQ